MVYMLEKGRIELSPSKMKALMNYPEPRTTKEIQRVLDLAAYFRKFFRDYARNARGLSNLLRKNANFMFEEEQRHVFTALKQVLHLYNRNKKMELHTDTSQEDYAASLLQRFPKD